MDELALLLLAVFMLTGCSGTTTVPTAVLAAVVAALKTSKHLKFSLAEFTKEEPKGESGGQVRVSEDRHKGFFAFRRAEVLGSAHEDWVNQPGYTQLIARVTQDFEEVESFANLAIGGPTGLAFTAPDGPCGVAPDGALKCEPNKHLDLQAVAQPEVSGSTSTDTVERYLAFRTRAARSIIWRAAALEPTLWNEAASPKQRLRRKALQELLDRRLRFVERMHTQVNAWDGPLVRGPQGTNRGPWLDKARLRMFEYPFLSREEDVSTPNGLTLLIQPREPYWIVESMAGGNPTYIKYANSSRLDNEPFQPSPVWTQGSGNFSYMRYFNATGPKKLSAAIDDLMQPSVDFWKRSWIYCDHVCTALHLDALRFALARQTPAGDFDSIPNTRRVYLGPTLGVVPEDLEAPEVPDYDDLFNDGKNATWFDNDFVAMAKLQVGDQVIFWNHVLYLAFFTGAWRLENSVITNLESDPITGGIVPLQMELEGDGMTSEIGQREMSGLAVFAKSMAAEMERGMNEARKRASEEELQGSKAFLLKQDYVFVRWKPYPGIDNGPNDEAPWFVYIPRKRDNRDYWGSVDTMLMTIYNSVLEDPSPSSNYTEPPSTAEIGELTFDLDDGVFYPLYLPKVATEKRAMSWRQYFVRLRRNPSLVVGLVPFPMWSPDPEWLMREHERDPEYNPKAWELTGAIPGLFLGGNRFLPVQALRPKARAV